MHDAKRTRMKMLSRLLYNYGIGLTLGAVFLPVLTRIDVAVWKEVTAILIGLMLSGLAIYGAPCGSA